MESLSWQGTPVGRVAVGSTVEWGTVLTPTNATNLDRIGTSSNESIATVTHSGTTRHRFIIHGQGVGTATIRITSDDNPAIYVEKEITVVAAGKNGVF